MTWESLAAILEEFGLPADLVDRDQIRTELRRQLAAIHPDRTGGTFATSEQESRFHRLSQALLFLDSDLPVPVALHAIEAKLVAIENRLAAWHVPIARDDSAGIRSDLVETVGREVASAYRLPRIGSAAFAAICGGIIAFSKVLEGNPLFGAIAGSRVAVATLLGTFIVSGAIFVITWLKERRSAQLVQWLLTDEGLGSTVGGVVYPRDGAKEPRTSITRREMVAHIKWFDQPWHKSRFVRNWKRLLFSGPVPLGVAEHIAQIQLAELLARDVVRPAGLRGVEPVFAIDPQRAQEILDSHAATLFRTTPY